MKVDDIPVFESTDDAEKAGYDLYERKRDHWSESIPICELCVYAEGNYYINHIGKLITTVDLKRRCRKCKIARIKFEINDRQKRLEIYRLSDKEEN
jgi:hypothetical protein